jgi:ketosteroid isomerase-like protein
MSRWTAVHVGPVGVAAVLCVAWFATACSAVNTPPATASASPSAAAPVAATPEESSNIQLVRDYYAAYATGDPEAIRRFLAPDVVWRIPGHHPLAGEKRGQDEVIAFFSELARGDFQAEPILFQAQGDRVVDVHRGWSNVGSPPEIDQLYALLFRIRDGKIIEAQNFVSDPAQSDNFYWKHFPLAPLPGRLAEPGQ